MQFFQSCFSCVVLSRSVLEIEIDGKTKKAMKLTFLTRDSCNTIISDLRRPRLGKHVGNASRTQRWGASSSLVPQIVVLVAMLLLVIFAMNEAGKPENWEWMGFEKQATDSGDTSAADQESPPPKVASKAPEGLSFKSTAPSAPQRNGLAEAMPQNSQNGAIEVAPDLGSIKATLGAAPSIPGQSGSASASEFWRSILGKMKPEQQSNFLKMLRVMRHGETLDPEIRQPCAALVNVISKNRDRYHQALFDQLTLAIDGSEEKKQLSLDLFESQAVWEEKILPALNAALEGEDFTLAQLQAVNRLQATLDPILFGQVIDKTAIGWTGDSEAWKRIWEYVLKSPSGNLISEESSASFKPVTRIELMSQPKHYRGKPIKVEGWVRAARIAAIENSELGISHQYILWVRPQETKQGPYCIYAHELPAGFPELSSQLSGKKPGKNGLADEEDLNERVEVEGYFFKVRNYVAADSSATTCPLIVAAKMKRIAPAASSISWQPSRALLISLLAMMPILAAAIAWWVFRSTQTKTYQPGARTASKIDQSLGALASDPNVQTDYEKIQTLYDSDLEDRESE